LEPRSKISERDCRLRPARRGARVCAVGLGLIVLAVASACGSGNGYLTGNEAPQVGRRPCIDCSGVCCSASPDGCCDDLGCTDSTDCTDVVPTCEDCTGVCCSDAPADCCDDESCDSSC
jgi:hypothetical protein